jgi:ribose transport system substrate-binding protein
MSIRSRISLLLAVLLIAAMVSVPMVSAKAPYNIAVIIKATDSDYWQAVLHGADAAVKELGGTVKVIYRGGPPSEADIDKQVAIVEDIVSKNPKAIVIASTSSDATVPALERAAAQGIKVVLVDNFVKLKESSYTSFLATDNLKGGALAAQKLVESLKAMNKPLKGTVGLISSMAGVQVLTDRDDGFTKEIAKIAPNIKIAPVRYVNNDIIQALSAVEDMLTTYPDLLGFFADNNHTGDGVSRAISERKLNNQLVGVAFDSDSEEVEAIKSGSLKALILQDPYGMGYYGVKYAIDAINGKKVAKRVDTGANAITLKNFTDKRSQELLFPMKK